MHEKEAYHLSRNPSVQEAFGAESKRKEQTQMQRFLECTEAGRQTKMSLFTKISEKKNR